MELLIGQLLALAAWCRGRGRGRGRGTAAGGEGLREKGVGADMRDDGRDAEKTELTYRLRCYKMMCQYHVPRQIKTGMV